MCAVKYNLCSHILPYIKKFGKHPVTGEKLDAKSLTKLVLFRSPNGEPWCPVTRRIFTNSSHVVAIRTTGHVFSHEAVEELNLKPKHYKDLINDVPFTKGDIIVLQDPYHLERFDISKFDHVKNDLRVKEDKVEEPPQNDPTYNLKCVNPETRDALLQLRKDYKPPRKEDAPGPSKLDSINAAHYSTGMVAAGFTSTVMEPITKQQPAIIDEDTLKYSRVKSKGYVRLVTNKGPLNFELHCELAPRACENFIVHCKTGYYTNTLFHRVIRNFVVQAGDPTGTGKGGESIWKKPFADEITKQLSHSGRGILSMANRGSNTNTSQFFITCRSCKQLDGKHTIFGRLVGGMETLSAIERVPTDDDRPLENIVILSSVVFVDPFEKACEQLREERQAALELQRTEAVTGNSDTSSKLPEIVKPVTFRTGVGKYIEMKPVKKRTQASEEDEDVQRLLKKRNVSGSTFKNFSVW
ncbi:peptidyl-prolyl cis-trans isomerase, cyclophilin-type [Trichuris suis]|nr:peptidyl-prolyl cis-trans isomerase, cyclophilin-type [Trichuris suis]